MPATPEEYDSNFKPALIVRRAGTPRGDEISNNPQTGISTLCQQAEGLVSLLEAGADHNDSENTNIRDMAFKRICAVGEELADRPAASPADVLGKIRLWRLLASEDALDPENCTPDEQLLLSIINDMEKYLDAP